MQRSRAGRDATWGTVAGPPCRFFLASGRSCNDEVSGEYFGADVKDAFDSFLVQKALSQSSILVSFLSFFFAGPIWTLEGASYRTWKYGSVNR